MTSYLSFKEAPSLFAIAQGRVNGARILRRQANGSVPASGTRSAWSDSTTGDQPVLSTNTALEVVSASANDTAAGTGARTLLVEAVDQDGEIFTETVTMNGTTPVALANNALVQILNATVVTAGTGRTNAGVISFRTVSGSTKQAEMIAGTGILTECRYIVPAGKVAFIVEASIATDRTVPVALVGRLLDAAPAGSPLYQMFRLSDRGARIVRDFGHVMKMTAGQLFVPNIINTDGAAAAVWNAEVIILEMDA